MLRDPMLQSCVENKTHVKVITCNGFQLEGVITSFDGYMIALRCRDGMKYMFHHNISTISTDGKGHPTKEVLSMVRQYTVTEAYRDNYRVTTYDNGLVRTERIVEIHSLSAYMAGIEALGYELAYVVSAYEEAVQEAREAYRAATEELKRAQQHPLFLRA